MPLAAFLNVKPLCLLAKTLFFFLWILFFSLCSYLLPHLLPYKPAMDIHGFRQRSNNTLQRLVKMSFVPAGFWERFIARMLISLKEMDLQVPVPAKFLHRASSIRSCSERHVFFRGLQKCCSSVCMSWSVFFVVVVLSSHLSLERIQGTSAARTL